MVVQAVSGGSSSNAIAAQQSAANNNSYSVVRGDCLWKIAQAHGVSLSALIAANPQIKNPDLIYPGDQVNIPAGGSAGGGVDAGASVGGAAGVGGVSQGGQASADIAKKYLGQWADTLQYNKNDKLPMQAGIPPNVCCANFVSAVLREAGQLPANMHDNTVTGLASKLKSLGWTVVPSGSPPQAGDVAIIKGNGISHTELVVSPTQMIGSNNRGARGQQVSYGNTSYCTNNGGYFLRPPAGSNGTGGTTGTGGATGTGGVTDPGTHQGRIDTAINYFTSQGWTRNQAIGIVANLQAESGMRSGQAQYGGGPGFGLAQWEGPRQADFKKWAGKDIRQSTFAEQLAFIQHELKTTESGAAARLRNAGSAADAAAIFCRYYERPADIVGDSNERRVIANNIAAGR